MINHYIKKILLFSLIFSSICTQCMKESIDLEVLSQEASNSAEKAFNDQAAKLACQNIYDQLIYDRLMVKIKNKKEAKVKKLLERIKVWNKSGLESIINLLDKNTGHLPLTQAIEIESPEIIGYLIEIAEAKISQQVLEFANSRTFSDEMVKFEINTLLLNSPENTVRAPSLVRKLRALKSFEREYYGTQNDSTEINKSISELTSKIDKPNISRIIVN